MALDFPSVPAVGDTFNSAGAVWTWDGVKWNAGTSTDAYLPLVGGTMSGPLLLAADPTQPLGAATRQYTDAGDAAFGQRIDTHRPTRNKLINGAMRVSQRTGTTAGTAFGAGVLGDRWGLSGSQPGILTGQNALASDLCGYTGFSNTIIITTSTAAALAADDLFYIWQTTEASDIAESLLGTVSALPITLSFTAYSTVTGLLGGSVRTGTTPYRCCPWGVEVGPSWTRYAVTLPGDTVGPWPLLGTDAGLSLFIGLGGGANWHGPPGIWNSNNNVTCDGAIPYATLAGAQLYLTGAQLEFGPVATPFERRLMAEEFAACQRYYETLDLHMCCSYVSSGSAYYTTRPYAVVKRASPTVVYTDVGNNGFPAGAPTNWTNSAAQITGYKVCNATAPGGYFYFTATADCDL
jgi:hypothetical protein